MSELPWARNPEPPDEPCVNPACEVSVYWPDEPHFAVTGWYPHLRRHNTVTGRACSLRCLALVLLAQAGVTADMTWAAEPGRDPR